MSNYLTLAAIFNDMSGPWADAEQLPFKDFGLYFKLVRKWKEAGSVAYVCKRRNNFDLFKTSESSDFYKNYQKALNFLQDVSV